VEQIMSRAEDDIAAMSDGELLALPSGSVPSGLLTLLWSRHAGILYQRRFDELNLELSGASSRHVMLFPGQSVDDKRRREEEEHQRRRYEEAMLDIQRRSDRLLAAIEFREREVEKRRQEIEDRALRLHDGRRVYFDGEGYRDETGRLLSGADANEAEGLHRARPDTPSWQERQKTIDEAAELERLRQKVLQERQQVEAGGQGLSSAELEQRSKDAQARMSSYEREFKADVNAAHEEMAKTPDVASAYADLSLDDYAGPAGGQGKSSAPDFTRAVAGVMAATKVPAVIVNVRPHEPQADM
jgi:hypothetical protein